MALEHTRFTIGSLNPNDVATFIVGVMLSLPASLKWSKSWVWFVLSVETILIALLIGTGSRGGVLALICGLFIGLVLCPPKKWQSERKKSWMCIALVFILGVGAGLAAFPQGFRLGTIDVSPEASAGRRLEVWSTVPAMLASALGGWGIGKSADAYEQWFEPVGEAVALKHLLSSHLTWLVEWGWPLRWLYLFFWMTVLALLTPNRIFRFPIWGFAVWTAFFVALFYNAAGKWWNWPIPVCWLVLALVFRFKQWTFPPLVYWIGSIIISGLLVASPFALSFAHPSQVRLRTWDNGDVTLIGSGKPMVAILAPNKDVLGQFFGQEIRKHLPHDSSDGGSVVVVDQPVSNVRDCLSNCDLFVISGEDEGALSEWKSAFTPKPGSKLILINCRLPVEDWFKQFHRVAVCHGEFYGDPYYADWQNRSQADSSVTVKNVPGHESYIPEWWPLLEIGSSK